MAAPLRAEGTTAQVGVPITTPVRNSLAQLQEYWLRWDSAFTRNAPNEAAAVLEEILLEAEDLGMRGVPDLAVAASVRAIDAAFDGDAERAHWALEMAERLDPKQPEVRFAAARVARLEGSVVRAAGHLLAGYQRALSQRLYRRIWLESLLVWLAASAVLGGALFMALEVVWRGPSLVQNVAVSISDYMPVSFAHVVAFAAVVWPLLLPSGWIWFLLAWMVLLWRDFGSRERVISAGLFIAILASPSLLALRQPALTIALSPEMRAVDHLDSRRLYGGLFQDLETLQSRLPGDAAVLHLVADLHLDLQQKEFGRAVYEELAQMEPGNSAAHNNLGVYFLQRREFGQAISHLEKAVLEEPPGRESLFNLYRVYREYLAFEEASRVLGRAQEHYPEAMTEWVEAEAGDVVMTRDGVNRREAITAALRDRLELDSPTQAAAALQWRSFLVCFGLTVLLSAVLAALGRRVGSARPWDLESSGVAGRVMELVPGLVPLQRHHYWIALGVSMLLAAGLLVPVVGRLGYLQPWVLDPGRSIAWLLAAVLVIISGLLSFLATRVPGYED